MASRVKKLKVREATKLFDLDPGKLNSNLKSISIDIENIYGKLSILSNLTHTSLWKSFKKKKNVGASAPGQMAYLQQQAIRTLFCYSI